MTATMQMWLHHFFGSYCSKSHVCDVRGEASNEVIKPSKLLVHLETRHPALKHMLVDYFERQDSQSQVLKFETSVNITALKVSYVADNCIAEPFDSGEQLQTTFVFGEAAASKVGHVPLGEHS